MRILHLADLHLDRAFAALPSDAAARRRAQLRAALRRCLAAARRHRCDAVTVGGDLWEGARVTAATLRFVARAFAAVAPLPVLLVGGNHDRLLAGGAHARTAWPRNVRVLGPSLEEARVSGGVSVWGASWSAAGLDASSLRAFRAPEDGRAHVLLMHAAPRGWPQLLAGRGAWGELDPRDVARRGFAACLGGHLHDALRIGPLVYPGSPEPLGWTDRGRHGCALVELGRGGARVRWLRVARGRHVARAVDAGGADAEELAARLAAALPPPGRSVFVRLRLVGRPRCAVEPERLAAPHGAAFGALVLRDATRSSASSPALRPAPLGR